MEEIVMPAAIGESLHGFPLPSIDDWNWSGDDANQGHSVHTRWWKNPYFDLSNEKFWYLLL